MSAHPFLPMTKPGPRNALEDVAGIRVGHYARTGNGYLTGTTVVLGPDGGMAASVDVRGGGPGSRETDLLAPTATVDRVDALVVTGGSAYGLAAASGVAEALAERGYGLRVGAQAHQLVPIVPAAVIFDLGRGGDFGAWPNAEFGRRAVDAGWGGGAATEPAEQSATATRGAPGMGCVGAGTGAVAGGLKGGLGQASAVLHDGAVIGALVVVNAAGSAVNPANGTLWGAPLLDDGDAPGLRAPSTEDRDALSRAAARGTRLPLDGDADEAGESIRNTTIAVVATTAALTKTQCAKLAAVGHNGFARALNPVHTLFDGDLVFGASTAATPPPDVLGFQRILAVAPNVITRAIVRAMLSAEGVATTGGAWMAYRELAPSSFDHL